jgi:NAD(P)-dependent dehydrogenase (short-subunit alcohol dehydrogenase family)
VATLLADDFRVTHHDGSGADFAAADPVHVLAYGWDAAEIADFLTRPGAGDRLASLTVVSGPAHRPHVGSRVLTGMRRLASRASAEAPRVGAAVDVPVQLIVEAGTAKSFAGLASRLTRLWRRDITVADWSVTSHPESVARWVRQLVEHIDGAPAARELLRAQVDRSRKAFGDTLVSVTGAGSGIGRETALAFARDGAEVVISDVDATGLQETARLVEATGAAAHSYSLDVADGAAVEAFAAQVCDEHGVPDIVVNNAGVGHAGFFLDTPAEEYDRVFDINFGGVVNGCRSFGKRLVERGTGGHIVNVASMASYAPVNVMNAYCTSKAAVFMFSDCLRAELDSAGVGLTTICPGVVGTNIIETTRFSLPDSRRDDDETLRRRVRKGFGARRYGPDKVAKAIVSAVAKNKPIRPVTPEAYFVYAASRALPPAMRSAARGGNVM